MTSVQSLRVENYKGVRSIELTPHGSLVVIAGGNGEGKSSFIDAIAELIDPKGVKLTAKPIRDGADKAVAELVTDEFIATRTWSKNDAGTLVVRTIDGARYDKASEFMRKVTGAGLFDPIAFVNLPEKEQRQELLARVELPFDLDELDKQRRAFYDLRTEINRDLARTEANLAAHAEPPADLPDSEVSAAEVLEEAEAARARNAKIDAAIDEAARLQSARERAERAVIDAEDALSRAREEHLAAQKAEVDHAAALQAMPEREDIAAITDRLRTIETTNALIRAEKERQRIAAQVAEQRAAVESLNRDMDAIDEQKRAALAAADFPVEGLSVDENGVTFEGIPFKQVNTARQRAVAFALLTAGDPRLRIAQIKDGDLLDANTLDEIRRIADERGFTVLIERDRDESREIGFTIAGGELAP